MRRWTTAALGTIAALTLASEPQAHRDLTGYVPCAETIPLEGYTSDSPPRMAVRNTCGYPVVGVLCVRSKTDGYLHRYDHPVNLPAYGQYVWTIYDPNAYGGYNSFACKPSAQCIAGPQAHDPHCHG